MENRLKRPFRRIPESELDKKSLDALGEYEIDIRYVCLYVVFKPQTLGISETERKALFEFGRDNNLDLCEVCINTGGNSYRATACYPSGDYEEGYHEEGWFEGLDEMGEQE
jgi:hypothetical protein